MAIRGLENRRAKAFRQVQVYQRVVARDLAEVCWDLFCHGVDLAHDSIIEIINLIQNSGLVKKPKIQPKKEQVADKQLIKFALEESPVPIVKKPVLKKAINNQQLEEKINQIAYQRKLAENKLSGLNEEFVKQKLRKQMS